MGVESQEGPGGNIINWLAFQACLHLLIESLTVFSLRKGVHDDMAKDENKQKKGARQTYRMEYVFGLGRDLPTDAEKYQGRIGLAGRVRVVGLLLKER